MMMMSQFELRRRFSEKDWAVVHKPTDTVVYAGHSVTAGVAMGWMLMAEDLMNSVEQLPLSSSDEEE